MLLPFLFFDTASHASYKMCKMAPGALVLMARGIKKIKLFLMHKITHSFMYPILFQAGHQAKLCKLHP